VFWGAARRGSQPRRWRVKPDSRKSDLPSEASSLEIEQLRNFAIEQWGPTSPRGCGRRA
jgi:hypothetical protein